MKLLYELKLFLKMFKCQISNHYGNETVISIELRTFENLNTQLETNVSVLQIKNSKINERKIENFQISILFQNIHKKLFQSDIYCYINTIKYSQICIYFKRYLIFIKRTVS